MLCLHTVGSRKKQEPCCSGALPPPLLLHHGRGLGISTHCLCVGWADPHQAPDLADSFWNPNAFETDSDLPAGWMRVQDTSGTYYWHIPTGTTQWEPPGRASPSQGSSPREESQVRLTGLLYFKQAAGVVHARAR